MPIQWCLVKKLKIIKKHSNGRQNIHCHIDFLTLDIIALKSNVIHHFDLFGSADYVEIIIFTFQGHLEVKTKMDNLRYL